MILDERPVQDLPEPENADLTVEPIVFMEVDQQEDVDSEPRMNEIDDQALSRRTESVEEQVGLDD